MQFVEAGGVMTMYLASGKRKHARTFWLQRLGGDIGTRFGLTEMRSAWGATGPFSANYF